MLNVLPSSDDFFPALSRCAACWSTKNNKKRFCCEPCRLVRPGEYTADTVETTRIGQDSDETVGSPHLHITCSTCGFTWLEPCVGLTATPKEADL